MQSSREKNAEASTSVATEAEGEEAAGPMPVSALEAHGISAADLPHIFDRFYRADRSRNRRSGGRGLGLAIVRQIVEQHGGRVWAESEQGQGSLFGFELPT